MTRSRFAAALLLAAIGAHTAPLAAQSYTDLDRQRAQLMLDVIGKDLLKYYYDSTYGGVPLRTLIDSTRAQLGRSQSNEQSFGLIGRVFLALGNSQTWFMPPTRVATVNYGWTAQSIGDSVYLTDVDTASDAYHQGVRAGDRLLGVDGFAMERRSYEVLMYVLNGLQPRTAVTLTVASDSGPPRQVHAAAAVTPGKQLWDLSGARGAGDIGAVLRQQESEDELRKVHLVSATPDILIWRMYSLGVPIADVRTALGRAAKGKTLILDLRGNVGGGWLATMQVLDALAPPSDSGRIVGRFFPRDRSQVGVVADLVGKDWQDTLYLKPDAKHAFTGQLIVLVDSKTYGRAEIVAAAVERLHLGTVLGDHTAAAMSFARAFIYHTPGLTTEAYGAQIATADFRLADGSRIEGVGVTPDETILPSPQDLRNGDDPVLARALAMAGDTVTTAQAGALHREKGDAFLSVPPRTRYVSPRRSPAGP